MTLTPMDIHNKEFSTKLRGYDSKQVDGFLDRIVDAYGDALDQIVDLKNENVELKKKVDKFEKVKDQIKELSDSDWQYYLDKYYGRSRLYPADGSQPLEDEQIPDGPLEDEVPSEETNSAISEVDNNTVNEVNSVQEKEDSAELLDGENSVKESMHATEESSERRDGPVIIFPDDLKDN